MTDKIRIVGSFGDNAVAQVQSLIYYLGDVQTASFLRDGVEQLPPLGEDAKTAAQASADQGVTAAPLAAPSKSEPEAPAPPFDAATSQDRRVGPADRREAPAQA